MARADGLPTLTTAFNPVVSDNNPLGVKGVGEVPTTGSPPAVVNAVLDALRGHGVHMPLTPERVAGARRTRIAPPSWTSWRPA